MQAGEPAALTSRYAASLMHRPMVISHRQHKPLQTIARFAIQLCHDQIVGVDQSSHIVLLLSALLPELAVAPCICLHVRMVIELPHLPTSWVCWGFISSSVCDLIAYIASWPLYKMPHGTLDAPQLIVSC